MKYEILKMLYVSGKKAESGSDQADGKTDGKKIKHIIYQPYTTFQ